MSSASPQAEDGHIRIATELFDALLAAGLTKREWAVVMAIVRKTYGWNKKEDDLGSTQIAWMTGLDSRNVRRALDSLAERRVIHMRPGRFGRIVSVQKDYTKWGPPGQGQISPGQNSPGQIDLQSGSNWPGLPGQNDPYPRVNLTHTEKQPQKTTPNKGGNLDFSNLPEGVSDAAAREWVEHRKKLRKPPTQTALDRAMAKAARAGDELGIGADEAIYTAIEAGWQGLEVDWLRNRFPSHHRSGTSSGEQPQPSRSRAARGGEL